MGAMGPREFEQHQARMSQELESLKTFFELTAAPPEDDEASSLPPDVRLEIQIKILRNSVRERIEHCRSLDDEIRRRWRRTLDTIDVFAPAAADDLAGPDGLADRVNAYAAGFPYHLGISNYSAAATLRDDLHSLAGKLSDLAMFCSRYQSRDWV
jgi:hypothetical protein